MDAAAVTIQRAARRWAVACRNRLPASRPLNPDATPFFPYQLEHKEDQAALAPIPCAPLGGGHELGPSGLLLQAGALLLPAGSLGIDGQPDVGEPHPAGCSPGGADQPSEAECHAIACAAAPVRAHDQVHDQFLADPDPDDVAELDCAVCPSCDCTSLDLSTDLSDFCCNECDVSIPAGQQMWVCYPCDFARCCRCQSLAPPAEVFGEGGRATYEASI